MTKEKEKSSKKIIRAKNNGTIAWHVSRTLLIAVPLATVAVDYLTVI